MSIGQQPQGGLQEGHEKLKRLFVDVGFGRCPVVDWGSREFGEDEIYLGLDLDLDQINRLKDKYKDSSNIQFKKVEGTKNEFHFPVPGGAASEVHIANVFGIPGAVDSHNLQLILEESKRILKVGGILSILETLTPNYTKGAFERILNLYHFKIVLSISPHSPEWQQCVAEYQNFEKDWDPKKGWNDSYYLIKAEKQP